MTSSLRLRQQPGELEQHEPDFGTTTVCRPNYLCGLFIFPISVIPSLFWVVLIWCCSLYLAAVQNHGGMSRDARQPYRAALAERVQICQKLIPAEMCCADTTLARYMNGFPREKPLFLPWRYVFIRRRGRRGRRANISDFNLQMWLRPPQG